MRSIKLPSWIERLAGLDPLPVPPHVFSLDEAGLAYGRFVRAESGFEVEDFAVVDLPEDLFSEGPLGGPLHDPGVFRPLLAELIAAVKVPVADASLVVPDAWLRLAFSEISELPKNESKRSDVLRWKLKRLVPFKVEDLRIQGVETQPLPAQSEAKRVLIGFGIENLLAQLEGVFSECGVRLGQIANSSLAAVDALNDVVQDVDLAAQVLISSDGYSLTFSRRGEPLFHRFRALDAAMSGETAGQLVMRDLKLTQTFLEDQLPGFALDRVLLLSPAPQQGFWTEALESALGAQPICLGREQLPLRGQIPEFSIARMASMVGAARREVA